jgi:type IV secretion system protein VirB4
VRHGLQLRGAPARCPILVDQGCPHAFGNPTDSPTRFFFQSSVPGGHENYFYELADLLNWSVVVDDGPTVIATKTHHLMSVLTYTSQDTEAMLPDERTLYLARLHSILATLDAGWSADFEWRHTVAPPPPPSAWPTIVHALIDETRRCTYASTPRFTSATHLTLTWQPPTGVKRWLGDLFTTQRTQEYAEYLGRHIDLFQAAVVRLADLLSQALLSVTMLDRDATCTYLHSCVDLDAGPLRCPDPATGLDVQLSGAPFIPGQPPQLGPYWLQPLTIKSWQPQLGTWLPEMLETLPFPCVWRVRWQPMSAQVAADYLRHLETGFRQRYKRLSGIIKSTVGVGQDANPAGDMDARADAIAAGQSIAAVQGEVLCGEDVLGFLAPTLLTYAPTPEALDEQTRALISLGFSQGLNLATETAGASFAWLASLPGHVGLGVRGRPLRTQELTALMPHSTVWSGPARDAHLDGPPVIVASTDSTYFNLVTHVGELGNVAVIGPARSGKSGLLGLLAYQWCRYPGARVVMFDRDHALKAATVSGSGRHYTFGTGTLGLQPLRAIETAQGQQWALSWVEGVLAGEGITTTPEDRAALWTAIQHLAELPPQARTISMLCKLLQVLRLKQALTPFCQGGPYDFLDASHDDMLLDGQLVCFEMGQLLQMPRALDAALAHILSQLETRWFTGEPVMVIVDEVKWLLEIQRFLGEMAVWLKARAKRNVSVILATQELIDLEQTDVWQAIQGSVPTQILLPNPAADRPGVREFYEKIGCSAGEIAQLVQGVRTRDYLYRSPLGSRLFQLVLSPLERRLCAASTLEELRVLEEMQATVAPDDLVETWCRHYGHTEAADILREAKEKEGVMQKDVLQ